MLIVTQEKQIVELFAENGIFSYNTFNLIDGSKKWIITYCYNEPKTNQEIVLGKYSSEKLCLDNLNMIYQKYRIYKVFQYIALIDGKNGMEEINEDILNSYDSNNMNIIDILANSCIMGDDQYIEEDTEINL